MAALSRHLTFFWQCVLIHGGHRQQLFARHLFGRYKAILLFSKGKPQLGQWIDDVYHGAGPEKTLHEWQQNVSESICFVERLSSPGDLIVDPFGGSFTTAEAVLRVGEGRRFIGCDIDKACVVRGQRRIEEVRKRLEKEGAK
jgi:hypothetical protein